MRADVAWAICEAVVGCGLAVGVMLALYDNRVFVPVAHRADTEVVIGYWSTVTVTAVAVSTLVFVPRVLCFVCITRHRHRASAKWWGRLGMVGLFGALVLMLYVYLFFDCNLYRFVENGRILKDECSPWVGVVPAVIVAGLLWGVEFLVVGVCELIVHFAPWSAGKAKAMLRETT